MKNFFKSKYTIFSIIILIAVVLGYVVSVNFISNQTGKFSYNNKQNMLGKLIHSGGDSGCTPGTFGYTLCQAIRDLTEHLAESIGEEPVGGLLQELARVNEVNQQNIMQPPTSPIQIRRIPGYEPPVNPIKIRVN